MTTEQGRQLFGAAVQAYDAGRPGYHHDLVPAVLTYAGGDVRAAVEVGAGTGKATVAFAAAGVPIVAVEPDPLMADVLRANTAAFPRVAVEGSAFEEWQRGARRFDLLFAATAWHWVDPAQRWTLAFSALRPGGVLALFWNPLGVLDPALHADLAEVDRDHGIVDSVPHSAMASAYGAEAGDWNTGDWNSGGIWPAADLRSESRFTDVREVRFRQEISYRAADYVQHLDSVGTYRRLPPKTRASALAATAAVLNRHGGTARMLLITDLLLARSTG